jgi:hypothetical protein
MMAHRRNVKNTGAHVNGPKKEHDRGHAEETSEDHGKDHGEQAREGGHQSRGATPGLQLQTVQAHRKDARRRPFKTGPAAQECDPLIAKHSSCQTGSYANTGGRPVPRRIKITNTAVSQTRRQGASTAVQH